MDDGWGKDSQLDTILRLKDLHPQEDDIFSPWPGGSSIQPIGSKDFAFGHRSIYQNTGVFPFVKAFTSPTQSPASVSPSSPASISPPTATVVDNTAADLFNAAYRFLDSDNVRTNGLNLPGQVDADLFSVDFVSDEDMRGELDFDMEGEKSPRFSANTAAPQQPVYQIQKPPSPAPPQQPFRPYAMNMNMLRKTNTMPEVPVAPDIANDVVSKQASHSSIVAAPPTQHPNGEHPSRTLFVRNINSNVDDEELRTIFEQFGPIRSMYTQCKHRGFVMISYYDIRHAKNAMKNLQSKILRRRRLDIHFSIPKDNPSEKDQNQGTLVVFNLDPSIGNRELRLIFGQYGEIKEIRETPHKKHHKFIEFFDVRDAERAMEMLNKTEIKSKKIKIEPSRPGGLRRQATEEPITASAPAAMQTIPSHTASEGNFNCRIVPSNARSATDLGSTASSASSSSSNSPHLATRSYSLNDSFVPGAEFDQESRLLNWSIDSDFDKSVDGGDWKINSSFGALPMNGNNANANISSSNNSFYCSSNNSSTSSLNHTIGTMSNKNSTSNVNNLGHTITNNNILSPVNSTNTNLISSNNNNNDKINNMNNSNLNMTINIEAVLNGSDDRTTLMIRNIPNKYTQRMLLTNIDEHHRKLYDFFYLPIDFKNKCNFGYAFINFITSEGIVDFYEKFHNKKWEKFNSEKVCQIMWARIQGKANLIANFQNSSLMCEDKKCRPVIFHSSGPLAGQLAPFPFVASPHNRRSKGQPLSPRSQQAQLSPRSQQQMQQQSPQQPQSPQSQQTSPSQSPYSSMGYSPQASPRSGNPNSMGNSASNISLNITNLGNGYQQPISPPTSHHVSPRHLGTSSLSPRHIPQSMYQSPFQSFPTFAPTFSAAQTPYADWS